MGKRNPNGKLGQWKAARRRGGRRAFGGLGEGRILFLIVAITVLVYANSLGGQFLYDDTKQIIDNPPAFVVKCFNAFTSDRLSFQRGTPTKDIPLPVLSAAVVVLLHHRLSVVRPLGTGLASAKSSRHAISTWASFTWFVA